MDDLISRAAAKEAIHDKIVSASTVVRMWKMLDSVPAVDTAPMAQGEWVEEPNRVNHYHCSNCGVVWGVMSKAMKYCPNCAAKMMNSPMWEVEDNNGKDA